MEGAQTEVGRCVLFAPCCHKASGTQTDTGWNAPLAGTSLINHSVPLRQSLFKQLEIIWIFPTRLENIVSRNSRMPISRNFSEYRRVYHIEPPISSVFDTEKFGFILSSFVENSKNPQN